MRAVTLALKTDMTTPATSAPPSVADRSATSTPTVHAVALEP